METKSENALIVLLNTNDTRNPVIIQWLDTLGSGKISTTVRDVLYRYVVGLLQPSGVKHPYTVHLSGNRKLSDRDTETTHVAWTIHAVTENEALDTALRFARDNFGDYVWHLRVGDIGE